VPPSASTAEIRAAYRDLARLLHPDTAAGRHEGEMAAVNEAWRVLSDPGRRATYDASLRTATAPRPSAAAAPLPFDDDHDDGDDDEAWELSPAEMEAARRLGVTLAITAVVVGVVLVALFVYAFTQSGSLPADPLP